MTALHVVAHIKTLQTDLRLIGKVQNLDLTKNTNEEYIHVFPSNSLNMKENKSLDQNIENNQQKIEIRKQVAETKRFEENHSQKLEPESIKPSHETIDEFSRRVSDRRLSTYSFNGKDHLTESEAFGQLRQCIERHNQMIDFVAKLENIFSHQSTIQFLSSSLTICLILFQMTFVSILRDHYKANLV